MSLMNLLNAAQGGQGLAKLGEQFGLDAAQTQNLAGMLAPALGRATATQAQSGGLGSVLDAFQGQGQASLLDDAAAAAQPAARAQGESFLNTIIGEPEVRNALETRAAEQSSVSQSTVAQFLPALAAMVQGAMQQQVPDSDISSLREQSSSGGLGGLLGGLSSMMGGGDNTQQGGGLGNILQMLDADGDGNPLDDIMGMLNKR